MEHYVGLDVSLKLTAICIIDRTGKIEREGVVASDPDAIATFIKLHAPHVVRIGLCRPITRSTPRSLSVPNGAHSAWASFSVLVGIRRLATVGRPG